MPQIINREVQGAPRKPTAWFLRGGPPTRFSFCSSDLMPPKSNSTRSRVTGDPPPGSGFARPSLYRPRRTPPSRPPSAHPSWLQSGPCFPNLTTHKTSLGALRAPPPAWRHVQPPRRTRARWRVCRAAAQRPATWLAPPGPNPIK